MHSVLDQKLYVRIHPESLTVRDVGSGAFVQEPPLVAISKGQKRGVLAVGNEASLLSGDPNVEIVNPFNHPRTPLSDFTFAEVLLKAFVKKLRGSRFSLLSPTMVMHLAVDLEGGITPIEIRALRELGIGAGARKSVGWIGPDLTDDQVRRFAFPATGRVVE
jgi:rod shape-determining protein MreB and related proteins